jgi:hypothetical protein
MNLFHAAIIASATASGKGHFDCSNPSVSARAARRHVAAENGQVGCSTRARLLRRVSAVVRQLVGQGFPVSDNTAALPPAGGFVAARGVVELAMAQEQSTRSARCPACFKNPA